MLRMLFEEKEYAENPQSGYLTDIISLQEFPDYIDYLPKGAIVRKVKVMGYMPKREESLYPYIGMTGEEYGFFVQRATSLVVEAVEKYMEKNT